MATPLGSLSDRYGRLPVLVAGYGAFQDEHERTLTDAERTTLAKWADAGAPLGDPKQMPAPRRFPHCPVIRRSSSNLWPLRCP